MGDKIKITAAGVEVEVEITGVSADKLEATAIRLFDHVAPRDEKGQRIGFVAPATGWSTLSESDRDLDV